jgi:hypothetical protein
MAGAQKAMIDHLQAFENQLRAERDSNLDSSKDLEA